MSLDLSSLLYSTVPNVPNLLDAITLGATERNALMDARTVLREGLRTCLREEVSRLTGEPAESVRPKFVTQGSVSYKTLNSPCKPPQQADLDDGIYLPLSYVQDTGQPSEASATLFDAVAACATHVANAHGWTVETDNPSCTRVVVSERIHIDIPLYAIPDTEFMRLVEARAMDSVQKSIRTLEEQDALDWTDVVSDRVLFATRDRGWLAKDPRPIREWVNEVVEEKGEQLRRVMRYIKAWRDHQTWSMGDDPKSIMLMVAAEAAFEEPILRRDDLALLATTRRMAEILNGPLFAPWDSTEDLAARLDRYDGLRDDVVERILALARGIDFAINGALTSQDACNKLRELFGSRVPDRTDLVLSASAIATPAIASNAPGMVGRQNNA